MTYTHALHYFQVKKVECRYDWHQTAQFVTISVFSKLTIPEKTFVECNRVKANINIVYDGGKSDFTKEIILQGVSSGYRHNIFPACSLGIKQYLVLN